MMPFELVAFTLPGTDPAIAVAASRAGGLGILNLEGIGDADAVAGAVTALARGAGPRAGLRCAGPMPDALARVLAQLPRAVTDVVFAARDGEQLLEYIRPVRAQGRRVWLEVVDTHQARAAQAWGADGLIAKGNEAGGWVGEETSFILLQRLLRATGLPILALGGIGIHSAVACYVAGAAGVVLDGQLALVSESPVPQPVQAAIAAMDGSETVCLGAELGAACRVYGLPGSPAATQLRQSAALLAASGDEGRAAGEWESAVRSRLGRGAPGEQVYLLGQDAAFAAPLAQRCGTVAGVFGAISAAVDGHVRLVQAARPLAPGGPLAQSHGTRYPIVQGPMTRVSDSAQFALRVAQEGGLPFLALALLRAPEVAALLEETRALLGERPWGVGILGFVPPELRNEQMAVIEQHRPPFAIIAGGRPDQARHLEQHGIPTYLHVPSPGLLRMFLRDGARRLIFEGRECGGHVGPRSSFVLWNSMIDVLLDELPADAASECHVLLAGGIHDALSASMAATMAAPLAERGVRVGVLLGTSYLFTREAVESGAIQPGFQDEALRCDQTMLLESGPGHATRCAQTAFGAQFAREKQRLEASGSPPDQLRAALEELNIGRLRIASKGIARHEHYGADPSAPKFVDLSDQQQRREGMYMIGQLAALRDEVCTIAELHQDVSDAATARLEAVAGHDAVVATPAAPCDIAVIGMACLLPRAPDLRTYWQNILDKVDAVGEVPPDRWDWQRYFDADRNAADKVYSRWGGFLDPIAFDPTRYGIPPRALRSIEPIQLLTLEAVRAALDDAGYGERPFGRERASVILGAGGGAGALGEQYSVRASLPGLLEPVPDAVLAQLPEWTEDSFPGILLNVIAGRVANRFDFGGVNYTVDAACASSLAAVYLAARELETGSSDLVVAGGVDNVQNPFGFLCFSKTQALSPSGRCRPFDDDADGIAISEGVAIVVLKRLADAERDGDRVYAVLKGIAGSSDGRDRSLTAPRPAGQARAVERAYAGAGVSAATVELVEAHGTGTVVGDQVEVTTLKQVFGAAGAEQQSCAIGSVKSMIGHTKCAAGVAGLIKVSLALHHRVLPPTLGVKQPNRRIGFEGSPFYVNGEARPWVHAAAQPRRAAVSAFGFGGTNFHAVLEEHTAARGHGPSDASHWPTELLLWTAPTQAALLEDIAALDGALAAGARPELAELAAALYDVFAARASTQGTPWVRLALVAASLDELASMLADARAALAAPAPPAAPARAGVYVSASTAAAGAVAWLFPGQGSQYPDMLRELTLAFGELRQAWEDADRALEGRFALPLSRVVFPPPAYTPAELEAQRATLTATRLAQPALGAAEIALCRLLDALGLRPDMLAGHSYGEYAALWAAGALDEATLLELSEARGRCIAEAAGDHAGTMAAARAGAAEVAGLLNGLEGVWISNLNAPNQTMISGTADAVARAVELLRGNGVGAKQVAVACAFHSPLVAPAKERFARELARAELRAPGIPVYSNSTAAAYPATGEAIRPLLAQHLVEPVRFAEQIEAMYDAGARVFVEVGPRNVLSGLVESILNGRPHLALALDRPGTPGLSQLQHVLAQLALHGVPLRLSRLYAGRVRSRPAAPGRAAARLEQLLRESLPRTLPPTAWLVDGARARPAHEQPQPHHPVPISTAGEGSPTAGVVVVAHGPATNGTKPAGNGNGQAPLVEPPARRMPPQTLAARPATATLRQAAAPQGSAVALQFQNLMGSFLETQRRVMGAYLAPARQPAPSDAVATPAVTHPPAADAAGRVERWTLRAVPRPLPAARSTLMPGSTVLITDDGQGVSDALASLFRQAGHPVALLAEPSSAPRNGSYALDLRLPEAIEQVLRRVRHEHGTVGALLHLAPLRTPAALDRLEAFRERIARETRSLFVLCKALGDDLHSAAGAGGAAVVVAGGMGGSFGLEAGDERAAHSMLTGGAPAGFAKTLAREWPDVRVKAVDLDATSRPAALAEQLWAECFAGDGAVEVGYQAGQRSVVEPAPAALAQKQRLVVDSDWVLLVTGGARGITADITLELAQRYRPTLILVGRSPLPEGDEAPATRNLEAPAELKAALTQQLRAASAATVTPAVVERAYRQLLARREIRRTLNDIAATGARVDYRPVDVRDAAQFGALIDELYRVYGRIDGVIHGAGIIEDKLIADKSIESFDSVLSTKLDSAWVLFRHLRPRSLRLMVLFGSVSGRFGNRGQADYAAANEALSKLALLYDRRWPARVVAISWGPWHKRGMVSPELLRAFGERGVALISPIEGRRAFHAELLYGTKGAAEVVLAGAAGTHNRPPARALPLLRGARTQQLADGVRVLRVVDPARDRFLRDHQLDGRPVWPFAMALELMAETVAQHWPEQQVTELRNMRLLGGIVLDRPRELAIVARRRAAPAGAGTVVEVTIEDARQPQRRHYSAEVLLADRAPPPPPGPPPAALEPFPLSLEQAYRQWLFHGPLFHGIVAIEGIAERRIVATLRPSAPEHCLTDGAGDWLADPIVFDSALQLIILWTRARLGTTPLPARFRRFRRWGSLAGTPLRCIVDITGDPAGGVFAADIAFADAGGLVGLLEGMECPSSAALNRLADTRVVEVP